MKARKGTKIQTQTVLKIHRNLIRLILSFEFFRVHLCLLKMETNLQTCKFRRYLNFKQIRPFSFLFRRDYTYKSA